MAKLALPFRGNLSDADIALLREFLEICAAGGLTAAEARLGKGKSAISLGLSRLEQRLGLRLCERGRSGFALTPQGRLVHAAAQQLMADIGRFTDFVGAAARRLEGEVTFFADDSFALYLEQPLARAMASLGAAFPELVINFRMTAPDRIFAAVLEGSADLGFTALIRPSEALETLSVCTEEMGIFCGRDHPLFAVPDAELTQDMLRAHDFVAANVTQEPAFVEFTRDLRIRATAPTILARMMLILSSRFLGFAPIDFARHWTLRGEIREIRLANSRAVNQCYLINRRARPLGLAAGFLRELLQAELRGV